MLKVLKRLVKRLFWQKSTKGNGCFTGFLFAEGLAKAAEALWKTQNSAEKNSV